MLTYNKQDGFTLLEVMIALVIFSIGLIGLAGLQAISLENNQVAYTRTMATMLAYDLADRIRNNPGQDYTATIPASAPTSCAGNAATIVPPACSPTQMRNFDLYEWQQTVNLTKNTALTNAEVSITSGAGAAGPYTISIGWDESRKGLSGFDCTVTPPTPAGAACVNLVVNL